MFISLNLSACFCQSFVSSISFSVSIPQIISHHLIVSLWIPSCVSDLFCPLCCVQCVSVCVVPCARCCVSLIVCLCFFWIADHLKNVTRARASLSLLSARDPTHSAHTVTRQQRAIQTHARRNYKSLFPPLNKKKNNQNITENIYF